MIETWPAGADLRFTDCEEMRSRWIASSTRMGDLLLGSQRTNAKGADADRHDESLGHGHAGIGLFLLELFRLTASSRFAEGANQAIERALELTAAKAASLGCYRESTGVAYVACQLAAATGDRQLETRAVSLAIEAYDNPDPVGFDAYSGLSGCVAPLLSMWRITGMAALHAVAARIGDRLVTDARKEPEGWCWNSPRLACTRALTGYAHGASGAAHALFELHRATGRGSYLYGARQAVAYEAQFLSSDKGNWQDLRDAPFMEAHATAAGRQQLAETVRKGEWRPPAPKYTVAWCHGAAGIGMTRLRAMQCDPQGEYHTDAVHAIHTVERVLGRQLPPPASVRAMALCHGTLGLCDLIVEADRAVPNASRMQLVHAWAEAASDVLNAFGPDEIRDSNRGLLKGVAGIGHFLLRASTPVSSVLLLTSGLPAAVPTDFASYNDARGLHIKWLAPVTSLVRNTSYRSMKTSQETVREGIERRLTRMETEAADSGDTALSEAVAIDRALMAVIDSIEDHCAEDRARASGIFPRDAGLAAERVLPITALVAGEHRSQLGTLWSGLDDSHVAVRVTRRNNLPAVELLGS